VGLGYAVGVEPRWLAVRRLAVTLPRLPAAFHRYRVVHLSDLHLSRPSEKPQLLQAMALAARERPDLIAVTGDFVTHPPGGIIPDLVDILRAARAPDGAVAVLGNHDHWAGAALVRRVLVDAGVAELGNDVRTLRRGDAALHVAGLDDVWEKQHRLERVLDVLPTEREAPASATLLLVHEPDFADTAAATGRFDLQLSGHSHGGQVRVPLLGPPLLPYLAQRYPRGLYHVPAPEGAPPLVQHTNPGLGSIRPRLRFGCRPEVTLLELRGPSDSTTAPRTLTSSGRPV
jgi:predicted MPP superfamily phosphohydrolase